MAFMPCNMGTPLASTVGPQHLAKDAYGVNVHDVSIDGIAHVTSQVLQEDKLVGRIAHEKPVQPDMANNESWLSEARLETTRAQTGEQILTTPPNCRRPATYSSHLILTRSTIEVAHFR